MDDVHGTSGVADTAGPADPARAAARPGEPTTAPRVFVSYAHEDDGHTDTVRLLASLLRARGVDAKLDLPAAEQRQDWPQWMADQLRKADYVLVIVSSEYRRRAEGHVSSGRGYGVRFEAALIRDLIYGDRDTWFPRVLPVLLPGQSRDDIPSWLGGYSGTAYWVPTMDDDGIEQLLRVLHSRPYEIEEPLGTAPPLPPRPSPGPWPAPAGPSEASRSSDSGAGGRAAGGRAAGGPHTPGSPPTTDLPFTVDDRWVLIDELAEVFSRPGDIDEFLDRVGLPRARRAHAETMQIRWTENMKTMTDGAIALPYWKVLVEALRRHRANQVFQRLARAYGVDPDAIR